MLLMVLGRLRWWVYGMVCHEKDDPHQPKQGREQPTLGERLVPVAEQRNGRRLQEGDRPQGHMAGGMG